MTFLQKTNLLLALRKSLEVCLQKLKTLQESRGWEEMERSERISKILSRMDRLYPILVSSEFLPLVEECQTLQEQLDQWLHLKQAEIQSEWISTEIQRKLNRYLFDGTIQ
jgi:hypothetical protein